MSHKREKPYPSRQVHARIFKRRRPWAPSAAEDDEITDKPTAKPPSPPGLVVTGLPADCSVLELKSLFEIYGSISRIRIDRDGSGFVAYRSAESAEAAIAASHEPSFGISVDSKRLQVMWATDPLVKWREGVTGGKEKHKTASSLSSSKLLRPEMPLRRHGRSNKLASAIVDPNSITNDGAAAGGSASATGTEFKSREIVAYDDIL